MFYGTTMLTIHVNKNGNAYKQEWKPEAGHDASNPRRWSLDSLHFPEQ